MSMSLTLCFDVSSSQMSVDVNPTTAGWQSYLIWFSQGITMLILATDMARHAEILDVFARFSSDGDFDLTQTDHLDSVCSTCTSKRGLSVTTATPLTYILVLRFCPRLMD